MASPAGTHAHGQNGRPQAPAERLRDAVQHALMIPAGPRPDATAPDGPDPYGPAEPSWLEIDWREHTARRRIGHTEVIVSEIGEGPPVVFIHGLAGCWQNWLENMPALAAAGYRAIAIDLPGFGASPMPAWEISMPSYGSLIEVLIADLGLRDVTLAGNSMGGLIVSEVASRQPTWLSRTLLVSPAGMLHASLGTLPMEVISRLTVAMAPLVNRYQHMGLHRPGLRYRAFRQVFHQPLKMRKQLLWEVMTRAIDAPGFAPAIRSIVGFNIKERVQRIDVPTLIVWGRDDRIIASQDAPRYQRRIVDSDLKIYAGCGHLAMAERPTRFNRELLEFLGS
jgi:pimeloyl-ACP methyl ester carboxylesterase